MDGQPPALSLPESGVDDALSLQSWHVESDQDPHIFLARG